MRSVRLAWFHRRPIVSRQFSSHPAHIIPVILHIEFTNYPYVHYGGSEIMLIQGWILLDRMIKVNTLISIVAVVSGNFLSINIIFAIIVTVRVYYALCVMVAVLS